MSRELSTEILDYAPRDPLMRCRLAGIPCLVAAEAKYHLQCLVEFTRRMNKSSSMDDSSIRDECHSRLNAEIRDGASRGHVYTLADVWNRFEHISADAGEDIGTYRGHRTRFKERLENDLRDVIHFVPQLHSRESILLFPRECEKCTIPSLKRKHGQLVDILSEKDITQSIPKDKCESDSLTSIYHVSLLIRNEIRSTSGITNCMALSEQDVMKVVPESLYLLLRLILTGEESNPGEEDTDDSTVRKKVLSLAQDLVFVASNSRKLTPKHVGLGMILHQATRSRDLVNLEHAAGNCISYDQVRRVYTDISNHMLATFAANDNVPIPSNIMPNMFFQFSADNIDIVEETLDGKSTFHATQMVAFQRSDTHGPGLSDVSIGKEKSLSTPDSLQSLTPAPKTQSRPTPEAEADIKIKWYDAVTDLDKTAEVSDLTWILTRLANPADQRVPFWTGFNQIVSEVTSDLTTVGHLPILNSPAHDADTLWTVIARCVQISRALNPGQTTVLTLDEQLYCKAKELQWDNPDECNTLVVRLGGFHIALNFMKAIGKHFTDSGLTDVWIESSVFGENTAVNNLSAKSYNRAIRAHKLTYKALMRILWPQFVDWLRNKEPPINLELDEKLTSLAELIAERQELDLVVEAYHDITDYLSECNMTELLAEFQSTRSPTVQYWQQYLDLVSLLLRFIRAERECNWALHLSAFAAMLPCFAIYDHTNYTRWGTVYLSDMHQLESKHPDVHRQFVAGNFVVKRTNKSFNQLSTDQALEHVNRVSKMAGGLVGITREDSARDRWCLTFNQRSQMVDDTYELFGFSDREGECSAWETKEGSPARLARDESDVQRITEQLIRFNVFQQKSTDLVSLSTRDVAPENIADALLNAEKREKEQVVKFVVHRLCDEPSKFHDALSRNKSPTLATMYHVTVKGSSVEKGKDVKAGRSLFQRLLVAQESKRDINLESLLRHELSKTPLSLTDSQGSLRPGNKADLVEIVASDVITNELPSSNLKTATVIDGHALVRAIGKPTNAKTFGELADVFYRTVCKKDGTRIDIVFDRYWDKSIKSETRTRRSGGFKIRPIRRIVDSRDVPLPINWNQFISLSDNKASLANFLSNELVSLSQSRPDRELVTAGGFTDMKEAASSTGRDVQMLKADHEEADTRIVLHCIDACRQGYERLVVSCRDTDVLVLLTYFFDKLCNEVWMSTGTAKSPKFVAIHDITLPPKILHNLPAYHALTGCDTVSQFSGYGKKLTWKAYQKSPELLDGLGVGQLSEETMTSVEEFVCKLYGPNSGIKSVNAIRCNMFRKGKVDPEKLPPTEDALIQHVRRAHYQSKIWRQASQPLQEVKSPVKYGWENDSETGGLKAVLTTIEPLPKYCMEVISCGCKNCSTTRCGCRNKTLLCTAACSCSDNVCYNPYNTGEIE